MGPDVSESVSTRRCADLTDVTLADEDTNSIRTDNRAIQGNVATQVKKNCTFGTGWLPLIQTKFV